MIPAIYKSIFLLPVAEGGMTVPYNMPNSPNYDKNKAKHNGVDLGWCEEQYCNLLAAQDGKVVQVIKNDVSGNRGNGIVLEHSYDDGSKIYTGYIHLKDVPTLKVGAEVKQGDVIGVRGGSPYINGKQKYGTHLHLYLTAPITGKSYSWSLLLDNVVDPYPHLYRSKKFNTGKLSSSAMKLPILEEALPQVVLPVKRDTKKDQLMTTYSKHNVRMKPSLSGTIIGYLEPNAYYDYYDFTEADGYTWYQIDAQQWVAATAYTSILPKVDGEAILKKEIAELTKQVDALNFEILRLNDRITKAKEALG